MANHTPPTLRHSVLLAALLAALAVTGCGGGGGGGSSGQTSGSGSGSGSSSGSGSTVSKAAAISFVSATPNVIVYQGGEGATQAEVRFLVTDAQGQALAGETVSFALNATVGGITLASSTAISDSNGEVVARVVSGSLPTSVRVTARAGTRTATSSVLAVSTGLPHQNGFSIAASNYSPQFYMNDGQSISITAYASDRKGNPVPDGTVVNFVTEGGIGIITPSCRTSNGSCKVDLISSGDRNALVDNGRQTVLAYMLGEESFNDSNNNGVFDSGEYVAGYDLGEAFLNARPKQARITPNKAQTWQTVAGLNYSEFYLDLNGNGIHDETGNGVFDGVARADGRAPSTLYINRSVEIIWAISDKSMISTPVRGSSALPAFGLCNSNPTTISYTPQDIFGNVLPSGTVINFSIETTASSAASRIDGDSSFTVDAKLNRPETYTTSLALATGATCNSISAENLSGDRVKISVTLPGSTTSNFNFSVF